MKGKKAIIILGAIAVSALAAATACSVDGGGDGGGHKHTWGEWQYTADEHYRECVDGDAEEREAHVFQNGECIKCHYPENGHFHVWKEWEHDTEWHWRDCEEGDATQRERHTFENGQCTECGYIENSIPGLTFTDNGEGYTVSNDRTFDMESVVIPSTYLGKPVTEIKGFSSKSCLRSITLPTSLKVIAASAFQRCTNLTSINVPEGVTTIGNSAFNNCTNLSSVTFPSTLTSVGNCLMSTAYEKDTGNFVDGVMYVGQYCIKLKVTFGAPVASPLNIKSGTKLIADGAFQSKAVKSVTLPESLKYIGELAFNGSDLTDINIPSGLTEIGYKAFMGCKSLERITGGSSVYEVNGNCVIQKSDKKLVVGCKNSQIPDSVKILGAGSLQNLGVSEFVLPAGLTKIEDEAFFDSNQQSATTIYYKGNKAQYGNIEIGSNIAQSLDVYYFSADEPPKNQEQTAYEGQWWKYGDGNKPEKWVLAE